MIFLLASFLAAASVQAGVTVEPVAPDRHRLTTIIPIRASPLQHAEAQVLLMREAQRVCRDRGRPVSDGTLEANAMAGGRIALSEVYRCVPEAEQR